MRVGLRAIWAAVAGCHLEIILNQTHGSLNCSKCHFVIVVRFRRNLSEKKIVALLNLSVGCVFSPCYSRQLVQTLRLAMNGAPIYLQIKTTSKEAKEVRSPSNLRDGVCLFEHQCRSNWWRWRWAGWLRPLARPATFRKEQVDSLTFSHAYSSYFDFRINYISRFQPIFRVKSNSHSGCRVRFRTHKLSVNVKANI